MTSFVFVIDEWDALIREAAYDGEAQNRYLDLLRSWFKNNSFKPKVVAAAYMTGILPIKKNSSQSVISDFREYSVLDPGVLPHSLALSSKRFARSSIPSCVAQGTRNSSRWYAVLTNCSRTHVSMN